MLTPKHSVCYVKHKIDYSVATISWRTANTTKAFINQSLGFSKQFRTLSIMIHKPIQHNDKKHPITTIFGMHTHNTRLRINTNMVKNTCILIGITECFSIYISRESIWCSGMVWYKVINLLIYCNTLFQIQCPSVYKIEESAMKRIGF